jgi:hypothetical protein
MNKENTVINVYKNCFMVIIEFEFGSVLLSFSVNLRVRH